jgi:hypothetical protein
MFVMGALQSPFRLHGNVSLTTARSRSSGSTGLTLLAFGLVHMFLIWNGDILTLYAICGPADRTAPLTAYYVAGDFRRRHNRALDQIALRRLVAYHRASYTCSRRFSHTYLFRGESQRHSGTAMA